jgi:hypothetical protein
MSYLIFEIIDYWEISTVVVVKAPARARSELLIPALDLLLQVSVGFLESLHVVQVGRQTVVEVLHGHLLIA